MYRPAQHQPTARAHGWTLIETMAAITILGFLVAMAVPSFARIGERHKTEESQAELLAAVQNARLEAIHRGQDITLRRVTGCNEATHPDDWRCGWTTFVDRNRNRILDPEDVLIQVHGPVQGQEIRLDGPDTQSLAYSPLGRTEPATQSLLLTPDRHGTSTPPRRLCMTLGGTRLKMVDGASSCW